MEIRLIAMDLDGTALSADRKHFSPRLDRCLLEAHRRGIAVLPVTGRQFSLLPPALLGDQPWRDLVVVCNGGELRRLTDGAVLAGHYIPAESLLRLVTLADRLRLPLEFSSGGTLYLTEADWELERAIGGPLTFHLDEILSRHGAAAEDLAALCRTPGMRFEKAMLSFIPDGSREEIAGELDRLEISWAWSGPNCVELAAPGASKARGLWDACGLLGIDPAQAMAIGDSGNDIPMLRTAGLGVAMGNAAEEVKAAADEITAANQGDGAAIAIERWALGERA